MSGHLATTTSDRGFRRMPAVSGTVGERPAGRVEVYESSCADFDALWLKITDHEGTATAVHLTLEAALQVAEQLTVLAVSE